MMAKQAKNDKRNNLKSKDAGKKLERILKLLCDNSSVHGLKYVVRNNGRIFSRFFWLVMLVISGFCASMLLKPLLENNDSVVDFLPNTLYLEWNTVFPAVTICETYLGYKGTLKKLMDLYPDLLEPLDHTKRKLYSDILFGVGSCSKSACGLCGEDIPCDFPWRKVAEVVRLKCPEMIEECQFNGWQFPCCKYFHIVDTENGPCIAFNSLLHEKASFIPIFTVNRSTGPGELFFKTKTSLSVYIHGPEEQATKYLLPNSRFDVIGNSLGSAEYIFSMVEMESDPAFAHEGIHVRECRYPDELIDEDMHRYSKYSYGACKLALETDEMYEICGCVHPIRDLAYEDHFCNLTGIHCLIYYKAEKIKLGVDKHKNHHHDDDICLPSCTEIEMSTILFRNERLPEPGMFNVTVKMANLPTIRYRRTLFKTNLDLVVTLGGMAGLFFGASILSLMETLHLLYRTTKL